MHIITNKITGGLLLWLYMLSLFCSPSPIYLPSNTKTHPHTKPSISDDLTVFLSLLPEADNIPTATKEGTSKDNHDHAPHYLTVVPDAGKIPASTKEGTSKDNHGPKPNANAWAKPNLGTVLAHKGWK